MAEGGRSVLVTGGTGALGRALVPELIARGHAVRVLSRRAGGDVGGAARQVGDVLAGTGLDDAVSEVDTVVHAASNYRRRVRETELAGTRNLLNALRRKDVSHFLYVSIVGVDGNSAVPYYRAKRDAEQVVEHFGAQWTVQRATQFHPLLDRMLSYGVFPTTRNLRFQPVAPADVAVRLADLVDGGPAGRAPDFGGPEVLGVPELAAIRRAVTGRRTRLLRLPVWGPLHGFDTGNQVCPEHTDGTVTWDQWLRERA